MVTYRCVCLRTLVLALCLLAALRCSGADPPDESQNSALAPQGERAVYVPGETVGNYWLMVRPLLLLFGALYELL